MTSPVDGERDIAVVGGGILGLAAARELLLRRPGASVVVLERESELARHQTGHNSGVIHAGIYYEPGSLKARLCVEGARDLYAYCEERGIPFERCGKLIVARDESELSRLDELERRGRANGVPGLRRLDASGVREIEPHARGVAALHSPATGLVDFAAVARAFAADVEAAGGRIVTDCPITSIGSDAGGSLGGPRGVRRQVVGIPSVFRAKFRPPGRVSPSMPGAAAGGGLRLGHTRGELRARFAVFCAGAWADELAVRAGADPDPRIVPFRGAYLRLRPDKSHLVRGLIYPVPDPALPFLGVHLSRHIDGNVSLGPSALLAPMRLGRSLAWPGTWRMARRWWRTGLSEIGHAASSRRFARAAAGYVPELEPGDFSPWYAGIRAQALARDGKLVDDFVISVTERAVHLRNAPSPAATSSLALACLIADRAEQELD
jgi:(S)-2-hydroxyglutarate dehydrogenase